MFYDIGWISLSVHSCLNCLVGGRKYRQSSSHFNLRIEVNWWYLSFSSVFCKLFPTLNRTFIYLFNLIEKWPSVELHFFLLKSSVNYIYSCWLFCHFVISFSMDSFRSVPLHFVMFLIFPFIILAFIFILCSFVHFCNYQHQ